MIDSPAGHGSGAYIGSNGVLTAAHVVTGRGPFTISFNDRRIGVAVISTLDSGDDLAFLSVPGLDASGAVALRWGDAERLHLGDPLTVVGYPSFVGITATQGIFSGLKSDGGTYFIQTDAAINPGNSGGPVVNADGQLVGIADWKILSVAGAAAQGLGFAVAATSARPFVERGTTATGPSIGDPSVVAVQVMATYYGYLQARDFYSAWSMLSEDSRLAQPYTDWVNGYSQTYTTRFVATSTARLSATSARVFGNVIATENFPNNPHGYVTQSIYSGYYDVAYIGARWIVQGGTLTLASRGFVPQ
ncbi:MAG: trypsin-like peptidase domain-containing protein [Chloroflexota bacterium]|nr:trypsin-like peptidase domain-containing protein [Chloroflexota bacterium]